MPLGISSAVLIKGLAIAVVIGLATALYMEIKDAGANEQKVIELNNRIVELDDALRKERQLREADQAAIKIRDEKIGAISRSFKENVKKLEASLQKARASDECIDKHIPVQIQKDVFGS